MPKALSRVHLPQRRYAARRIGPCAHRLHCPHAFHEEGTMSIVLRASTIALLLSLAACDDGPGTQAAAVVGTASASEAAGAQREYYGRTEFEIPGGDGQVV